MIDETDQQLLARYANGENAHALQEILRRYGSLIKGVCVRVLGNPHDADDAIQATLMVLIRKAGTLSASQKTNLPGWLYTVAHHCAIRLKKTYMDRQKIEKTLEEEEAMEATSKSVSEEAWESIAPILDEELSAISETYRYPLIYCYLEGESYDAAAQRLGITFEAFKKRLTRGREQLRKRLVKRGLGSKVTGSVLGAVILEHATSSTYAVTDTSIQTILQSVMATGSTAGVSKPMGTAAAIASAISHKLSQGVLLAMNIKKVVTITSISLAAAALTGVFILGTGQNTPSPALAPSQAVKQPAPPKPQIEKEVPKPVEARNFQKEMEAQWEQASQSANELAQKRPLQRWEEFFTEIMCARPNMEMERFTELFRQWMKKDSHVASRWGIAKFNEVVAELMSPGGKSEDDKKLQYYKCLLLLLSLPEAWGEQDPQAAIQWVQTLEKQGPTRGNACSRIATGWSRRDPVAAANWVLSLSPTEIELHEECLENALVEWFKQDAQAAMQWSSTIEDPKLRLLAQRAVFCEMAAKKPEDVKDLMQKYPNAIPGILLGLARSDPLKAAEFSLNIPDDSTKAEAFEKVWVYWLRKDPAAAARWEYARWSVESPGRDSRLDDAITGWAKRDPTAAWNFLSHFSQKQIEKLDDEHSTIRTVEGYLAFMDPQSFFDRLSSINIKNDKNSILKNAFWMLFKRDEKAGLKAANMVTDPEIRKELLVEAALEKVRKDPAEAAKWAESLPAEARPKVDETIVKAQIYALAQSGSDFGSALAEVQKLPENLRANGMVVLGVAWSPKLSKPPTPEVEKSMMDLYGWVESLPDSKDKRKLVDDLARSGIRMSPEWSDNLYRRHATVVLQGTPEKDLGMLQFTLRVWSEKHRESAIQWVNQTQLSEARKKELLGYIRH